MNRKLSLIVLFFLSALIFAQHNPSFMVYGRIPAATDRNFYEIQVGAFTVYQNAERVFDRLNRASMNPVYERYNNFTRVIIKGINAENIPFYLDILRSMAFTEVLIRLDSGGGIAAQRPAPAAPVQAPPASIPFTPALPTPVQPASTPALPVSRTALPMRESAEIAHRTIRMGEQINLANLVRDRNIVSWTSSTPQAASVDQRGNVTGLILGNALIHINPLEYISVAVVPAADFYVVPETMTANLPLDSRSGSANTINLDEYVTEPTFRLAYRWNNRGEERGASGPNGGIDIMARGRDYEWLWTSYYQGGWFYNLNGVKS